MIGLKGFIYTYKLIADDDQTAVAEKESLGADQFLYVLLYNSESTCLLISLLTLALTNPLTRR